MVADRGRPKARLLEELAGAGLLDGLSGLKEPCEGREHAGGPGRLASQHAAVAMHGKHDDHRVRSREVIGAAGRTLAFPAALRGPGRFAAGGTGAMLATPFEDALGCADDGGLARRKTGGQGPGVLEAAHALQWAVGGIRRTFEVDGEHRGLLPKAHEQEPFGPAGQVLNKARGQVGDLGSARGGPLDKGLPVPEHEAQGLVGSKAFSEPGSVLAVLADAVEGIAGEGVLEGVQGHESDISPQAEFCTRLRRGPGIAI